MNENQIIPKNLFDDIPQIGLVYLFGSHAEGKVGPLSDYDFGVYLDEKNPEKRFAIQMQLLDRFNRFLRTDRVDLIVLNDAKKPELKYQIISSGKLIFEREPFKVLVEPQILNEYFDFRLTLKNAGLIPSL